MQVDINTRIVNLQLDFNEEEAILFKQLIGNVQIDELVANAEMVDITIDRNRMTTFLNTLYAKLVDKIPVKLEP